MRARTHKSFGLDGVLVPGEGFRITRVDPDSPAARLGLECGDLVTRVLGFPPEHADVYRVLTGLCPLATPMRIEVQDEEGHSVHKVHRA